MVLPWRPLPRLVGGDAQVPETDGFAQPPLTFDLPLFREEHHERERDAQTYQRRDGELEAEEEEALDVSLHKSL